MNTSCTIFKISFFCCILCLLTVTSQLAAGDFLFSLEEAEQLRLSEKEWNSPPIRTRGIPKGPVITFKQPEVSNSSNPTLEASSPQGGLFQTACSKARLQLSACATGRGALHR